MGKGERNRQRHTAVTGENWWDKHGAQALIFGGIAALIIFATGIAVVIAGAQEDRATRYKESPITMTRVDANTVTLGTNPEAPVLDIYSDPLCPFCNQFETNYSEEMLQAAENGEVQLQYNQLNILDGSSDTGNYSSRVGGAYDVLAQQGDGGVYIHFHHWVYDNQPPRGSSLSEEKIIEGLEEAGATPETITAYTGQNWADGYLRAANEGWAYVQETAEEPGVPTVFTEDKQVVNLQDKDWLEKV